MGFLSQVPLSARFLLYRAVRGGLGNVAARPRKRNTTERIFPLWLGRTNNGGKGFTIATKFSRTVEGRVFSSHPQANLLYKGSSKGKQKKCCGRPRTAPKQQSTGILFS